MKRILLFTVTLCFITTAFSQTLERKAFFGIQLQPVTEEIAQANNLPEGQGVLANFVVPGSTAEGANIKKGDVLIEINGKSLTNPNQTVDIVRSFKEGDKLEYKLVRNGKTIAGKATVKGLPKESYPDLNVTYGSVKSGNNLLRTIVMEPKTSGKKPAIFYIQGVGCYSMDSPLDTNRTEIQFLRMLARKGYAVLRLEKPGVGDSKGGPCDKIDFDEELKANIDALKSFKKLPGIDSNNIYIFGHSMGGVMAPLVAEETPVEGIIVYGTIGTNFIEYFVNSRRNITEAMNMPPVEADQYIKSQTECMSLMVAHKMSKSEALKLNNACGETYDGFGFRANEFWYDLYNINIPNTFKNYDGKVLAIWGESDYVSTKQEHEQVVNAVNFYNAGNGTLATVPGADHGMNVAPTFQDAAQQEPRPLNTKVTDVVLNWLNNI